MFKELKPKLKYSFQELPIPVQNYLRNELGKVIGAVGIVAVLVLLTGFDQFCLTLCLAACLWLITIIHKRYLFMADKVIVIQGICKSIDRKAINVKKIFRIYGNSEMELEDDINVYKVSVGYGINCKEGNTVKVYTMPYSIYEQDDHIYKISSSFFISS